MISKNILIVDDSALMRRVLSDIIESDKRFVVKDTAVNGFEALDLIDKNYKDYSAVILDINMPKMSGIQLLEEVNRRGIRIPIIIVSTIAKEGASETIRSLELGAFDFITKPDSFVEAKSDAFKNTILNMLESATKTEGGINESLRMAKDLSAEALDRIRSISSESGDRQNAISALRKAATTKQGIVKREHKKGVKGKKLVALACSTGGPKALQSVIPFLPGNLDASVLIVQHMPEGFTLSLANRLSEMGPIEVRESRDGEKIEKGRVYIAKGGFQMKLEQSCGESFLTLTKDPPRGGLRPCADIMYESLIGTDYDLICCVVLTGMGADGTLGITQLNETNNIYVIAQDEESSIVYGMPKTVAETGLVDEVLPLNKIADAITRAVGVQ